MADNTEISDNSGKQNRLKSAGIVIVTLIIGMVLGGLITARIVHNRMDHIADVRSQRGFTRFIERSIEYESPEQRREVGRILDRTAENMFRHLRLSRKQTVQILDSARAKLGEILSEKQMERLDKRLRHHRRKHPIGRSEDSTRRRHRP